MAAAASINTYNVYTSSTLKTSSRRRRRRMAGRGGGAARLTSLRVWGASLRRQCQRRRQPRSCQQILRPRRKQTSRTYI